MNNLKKNVKLKSKNNILENGFVKINDFIYRKLIYIGYNVGMYVTIGVKDDFLNIAIINEQFLQPFNLELVQGKFAQNFIINYNNQIKTLIEAGILEEIA